MSNNLNYMSKMFGKKIFYPGSSVTLSRLTKRSPELCVIQKKSEDRDEIMLFSTSSTCLSNIVKMNHFLFFDE